MGVHIARGRFVWCDLMTSDPQAAQAFYTKVAGWGTQAWDGPMPYTMWTAAAGPVGGVMQLPDSESHPHWLAYISTPDCDATAQQAKDLGGTVVVPPQDIPEVGRFTVIQDPQGAYFSAFTPARETPDPDSEPTPGQFSWHELATSEADGAIAFYTTLFGWKVSNAFDMGGGWMYHMFGRGGRDLGGIFTKPAEMPGPPAWCHYIMVDDVHAAAERVKANGGQVFNGPMEVPGGDWIAQGFDPQGGMFAVHGKK